MLHLQNKASMSNNRERDLVLAPNEYAFISDQTKGNVITYVGPYKTSMANTDQPVFFNHADKTFDACNLEDAIQTFATAPEGWYIVLKNPSSNNKQPQIGTSNNSSELEIGRKVNLPGPCFFALWPGQMAQITKGHHLRSNEYLVVRVYEENQARANWDNAVMTPQQSTPEQLNSEDLLSGEIKPEALSMGQLLIIRGTNVSFYIPPTGIEVVKDKGEYVRRAVTLERLEYCILLDEDGNKRYVKGPAVVFPRPTERFVEQQGSRKFKAIELNENSGIYVKVIAPYEEGEASYKTGDELFITGKDQMIYYPRPEHALVKYGSQEIYHAVAIPHGEGRYFLSHNTGKISLQKGPCMFLPDPREAVIVRRILNSKQVGLWFPGNEEAMLYNNRLQEISEQQQQRLRKSNLSQKRSILPPASQNQLVYEAMSDDEEQAIEGIVGNTFDRNTGQAKPRTLTLNNKYEGAVTIDLWTGYAALVTSKVGERKVIVGPQTYLLEYDEVLQGVELSTGTPKTDDNTLRTVYLRVLNNKVSDLVQVQTKDLCNVEIAVSYRVNFTGDQNKWFDVENYVKFLTDHLRSVLRNSLKQYSIADFYANGIAIVRNLILGERGEEGKRRGWLFRENGMHVYELEVLEINILDEEIEDLLFTNKHQEIRKNIELANKHKELDFTKEVERLQQEMAAAKSETKQLQLELQKVDLEKNAEVALQRVKGDFEVEQASLESQLKHQEQSAAINALRLEQEKARQAVVLERTQKEMEQRLEELRAEVNAVVEKAGAVSPDLIAALQAFGDKALAEKMAETMAPLSIIGGKSIVDVFANLVKGTKLEQVLSLKAAEDDTTDTEEA